MTKTMRVYQKREKKNELTEYGKKKYQCELDISFMLWLMTTKIKLVGYAWT